MPDDVLQYACCDVNSRGVAYADGKIFVGRLDGKLVALDAKTGKELWTANVVDYTQGAVITSPPLVVKDKVITGFGGGEYGVRGSLQAYDINTGKQVWKTYTVPLKDEPSGDTWKGDFGRARRRGALARRLLRSEDQHRFLGHQQSRPLEHRGALDRQRQLRQADQPLYGLDAGARRRHRQIKWWVQGTPADAWDYDGVNELVLADLKIDGETVPAMMKADRNGFFFVVNRETGKVLSAREIRSDDLGREVGHRRQAAPSKSPDKRAGPESSGQGGLPEPHRRQELAADVV